ncbi:hypothetical protein HDC90_001018 [Pedobacter sp. AK013]|uniref:hypothetical protein n=1 Tax=Pedobacter sp. AK013 TaxID=2723071 RepID=UPI00160AF76A|nr:hypothetical protein [Pedobacter sp. AK013]MBB6236406.1 hypothetical protein [Pedobacter sp. AK013]
MKKLLVVITIVCFSITISAQEIINPYLAVGGGYANYSGSVLNSYYPVLGVMAEHGAGQKMLVSTGYGSGLLDMFTKISSWSRKPTIGNIDSTNFIAIGQNGNSYTPGNFIVDGKIGIGITTPVEKLSVNGNIRSKEVKVEATNWPDYVFDENYKVEKLEELENYIKTNKHLPEMPTAKEVEVNGIALGEINRLLLKKVEELTLHLIEQQKQLNEQGKVIKALQEKSSAKK